MSKQTKTIDELWRNVVCAAATMAAILLVPRL